MLRTFKQLVSFIEVITKITSSIPSMRLRERIPMSMSIMNNSTPKVLHSMERMSTTTMTITATMIIMTTNTMRTMNTMVM